MRFKLRSAATLVASAVALAVALGSLSPALARLLPWYAPQWTHVLIYAVFALATCAAVAGVRHGALNVLILTGGFGLLVELAQLLVPTRTASPTDAFLNVLGAVLGVSVFVFANRLLGASAARLGATEADASQDDAAPMGAQLERLAADRLLPVAPLLYRRGQLSPVLASLAMQAVKIAPRLGNAPADDAAVVAALDAGGVRCLVLKGTLLAHTVYDHPEQRVRGDTDLLVAPSDRAAAEAALRDRGLRPAWSVTAKTSDTQDQWHGRIEGRPLAIDLHWQLINHPAFDGLFDFDRLWQQRQTFSLDALPAAGLGAVDALLHAAVHYFGHHGDEFRPDQWLLDGDLLWRGLSEQKRRVLIDCADAAGLSGILGAYLKRARRRFETPVRDEMLNGLIERGRHEWRSRIVTLNGRPVPELLFALRARPTWRARASHLRALLFPSPRYMRSRYPEAPRLALPWLYVRRALNGLFRRDS